MDFFFILAIFLAIITVDQFTPFPIAACCTPPFCHACPWQQVSSFFLAGSTVRSQGKGVHEECRVYGS